LAQVLTRPKATCLHLRLDQRVTLSSEGLPSEAPVFLQACRLVSPSGNAPFNAPVWQHQRQWHVLQAGFENGLLFLSTWQAWLQDAARPDRLFVTAIGEQLPSAQDWLATAKAHPELQPLAEPLARAWRGLLPGTHRLIFEGGRVQLTLCVGPLEKALRELDVVADSVFLAGSVFAATTGLQTLQAISRLCRTHTRLALRAGHGDPGPQAWKQCGFELQTAAANNTGHEASTAVTEAVYAPAWVPRTRLRHTLPPASRQALVIGAGLSGAAVAHSLALRGWQVTVLDQADGVGAGASGLPAGLTAPHVSPDDSVLSRITRAGVRATLQRAASLLNHGTDWAPTGVLEHRVEGKRSLPVGLAWPTAGHEWSTPASTAQITAAGLAAQSPALWHDMAGWIRPRQLAAAQLQTPGVRVMWGQAVAHISIADASSAPASTGSTETPPTMWQACDAQGQVIALAPLVVFAGGFDTLHLLRGLAAPEEKSPVPLNPLRGQISFGLTAALPTEATAQLPPFPVNGHGSFISGVPTPDGQPGWFIGSTFERNCIQAPIRTEDHAANRLRLATLLPGLGEAMAPQFEPDHVQGWAGLRCTLPDRLPAVGPVDSERWPGVWMSAGMGARGISLAVLCGELTAAWLENEPLPLEPALAKHLAAARFKN
jgi:tRNA 5-methylaminomethyl-2-thiouridine biosynthesis bifunctional protein